MFRQIKKQRQLFYFYQTKDGNAPRCASSKRLDQPFIITVTNQITGAISVHSGLRRMVYILWSLGLRGNPRMSDRILFRYLTIATILGIIALFGHCGNIGRSAALPVLETWLDFCGKNNLCNRCILSGTSPVFLVPT